MPKIAISSGHGLKVRGAAGVIDEVDEARRVVDHLADELEKRGIDVYVFHDNTSTTQSQNLNTIVNAHNSQNRDFDLSVHFNAYEQVEKPMGCEVLYLTQQTAAAKLSDAISREGGFINRGAKKRTDLAFLNNTEMPACLIEVCFVDSVADCELYEENFHAICVGIAELFGHDEETAHPPEVTLPPTIGAPAPPVVYIEVEGDVRILVNGTEVGTKG